MNMKTILFQGDSITDAGRVRDNDAIMGYGYPTYLPIIGWVTEYIPSLQVMN